MSGLWTYMEHPARRLGVRTVPAYRTSTTSLSGKHDLHAFSCLAQASTGLPLGTRCLPSGPINGEMSQVEALARFGLPTVVSQGRTDQFDPPLGTAHQQIGVYIARIDDLLLRLEFSFDQLLLNDARHFHILDRRFPRDTQRVSEKGENA